MKIEYINNPTLLADCVKHLETQSIIALDLEFDNYHFHYGFKLCLVQIASKERCFVIDPYEVEINSLFGVLENPKIQKVLHSVGEDLRLLQLLGCFCKNIFDTYIACQLLNHSLLGLDKVIYFTLDIVVDKQAQSSDWTVRPLTKTQIMYAGNDVIYLIDVKNVLEKEIEKKNMTAWLHEENVHYDSFIFPLETSPFDLRKLGKDEEKFYSPYDFHILLEVLKFREEKAVFFDRPPHQIFSRDVAKTLAFSPQKGQDFLETRGIMRYLKNIEFEEEFIKIVENAHQYAEEHQLSKNILPKNNEQQKKNSDRKEYNFKNNKQITQKLDTVFSPIQQKITEKYGENLARKILSTNTAREIAGKTLKFENIKFQYKKDIIFEVAKELNISLTEFL